ncbi:MAG: DUF4214 domain-containing protein [Devosia sp.]|nr:DUF4214 domain-containing protein [Devosia sp.]
MADYRGTSGSDRLIGGDEDDWFERLGAGNDQIDGKGGWNGVSYRDDGGRKGIVLQLNADGSGTVTDTHGDTDTLAHINDIEGSRFSDILRFGKGVDVHVNPGFGSNTISLDAPQWATISYHWLYGRDEPMARHPDFFGVKILLGEGKVYKFNTEVDTITVTPEMEFRGTHYNDVIEGANDGIATRLAGMGGSDLLIAGDRHDYVDYRREGQEIGTGFTIDLAAGRASNGANGDVDTLVGFVRVHGSNHDDTIIGNAQDNFIVGYGGDDRIDGGGGLDTAAYWDRDQGDLKITGIGTGTVTVVDLKGDWGTDTLTNIERIDFGGTGLLAIDINGNAGQAYRLYQAAFDRTPDDEGLHYWIHRLDSGETNLASIARSFLDSPEFVGTYGTETTVSNGRFIELLYKHALSRDLDQEGYDYWVGRLDGGQTNRSDLLVQFSESDENKARVFDQISDGIWLG